jgi:hypothetical protein
VKACRKLLELDPSQLGDQYNALVYNEETGEWELGSQRPTAAL